MATAQARRGLTPGRPAPQADSRDPMCAARTTLALGLVFCAFAYLRALVWAPVALALFWIGSLLAG
jgi:hypothetical protein